MKKKVVITISARWDGNYSVKIDVDTAILNHYMEKLLKLCRLLSMLDVWSKGNSYYCTLFELPSTLHDFLYSSDFDNCVHKCLNVDDVDIVKF